MEDQREVAQTELLAEMVALSVRAGRVVWDLFSAGLAVERKRDASPVTEADRAAERVILMGLAEAAPGVPAIAEEAVAAGRVPTAGRRFFLVDPLDGTREFIAGGTDFTVNIGLVEDGAPVLGVVYAPGRDLLAWGDAAAGVAWRAHQPPRGPQGIPERIRVRAPGRALRAVASKSHNTPHAEAWLAQAGVGDRVSIGSSLKFVLVASGEADVYPRPSPTMEWDTAAGDAILRAAGGRVLDIDHAPLAYGKPRFFNPGFIATGPYDPAPLRSVLAP